VVGLLFTASPITSKAQTSPLDPPDTSCLTAYADAIVLHVCGGGWGGAPGGFVVQYQTLADANANGWPDNGATPSSTFCQTTFVGGSWNLGMHECVDIQFGKNLFNQPGVTTTCPGGAPLTCNTTYVFRAKALATSNMTESGWTLSALQCSTDEDCANTAQLEGLTPLDPPDLFCQTQFSNAIVLHVCGGGWGGAPGGFVIQWQTAADRNANGWPDNGATPSPSLCEATFTGGSWNLGMHECVDIQFGANLFNQPGVTTTCPGGAPLTCGTNYVFRSKALGTSTMTESGWIGDLHCNTDFDCANPAPGTGEEEGGCTYTQGYWKNHASAWPVQSLTLGTVSYSKAQLLRIPNQPARGNGLVSLAHQLIAAKLNVASGASDASIASTIVSADAMIGGRVVPPIGSGSLSPASTSSLTNTLDSYNEGDIGPGHCD